MAVKISNEVAHVVYLVCRPNYIAPERHMVRYSRSIRPGQAYNLRLQLFQL
jgi:hypothetical protein